MLSRGQYLFNYRILCFESPQITLDSQLKQPLIEMQACIKIAGCYDHVVYRSDHSRFPPDIWRQGMVLRLVIIFGFQVLPRRAIPVPLASALS